MCIDCATKKGYTIVPYPIGVWVEKCEVCGKDKPTADLNHDFYPPDTPKDVIVREYASYATAEHRADESAAAEHAYCEDDEPSEHDVYEARISQLERDNAELRSALRRVVNCCDSTCGEMGPCKTCIVMRVKLGEL